VLKENKCSWKVLLGRVFFFLGLGGGGVS